MVRPCRQMPRPLARFTFKNVFVVAFASIFVCACQTGGTGSSYVTLEDAKKFEAEFKNVTFAPPPRTTTSIADILRQSNTNVPMKIKMARGDAYSEPWPNSTDDEIAQFLLLTGKAAGVIGDVGKQLSDLRKAEKLYSGKNVQVRLNILKTLAIAEFSSGNFEATVRYAEKAIEIHPTKNPLKLIGMKAAIANAFVAAGYFDKTEKLLEGAESALSGIQNSNAMGARFNIRSAMANLMAMKGEFKTSEILFRKALAQGNYGQRGTTNQIIARINLSNLLIRQGRHVEAEVEIRKAITYARDGEGVNSPLTAMAVNALISVLNEQGRFNEAEQLGRELVALYGRMEMRQGSYSLVKAKIGIAESMANQGKWQEAIKQYLAVKNVLSSAPVLFQRLVGENLAYPLTLIAIGEYHKAESISSDMLTVSNQIYGETGFQTNLVRGVLAIALTKLDKNLEATQAFEKAMPHLLSVQSQQQFGDSVQSARSHQLDIVLSAYLAFLADPKNLTHLKLKRNGAIAIAFEVADFLRGRAVQGAVTLANARAASGDLEMSKVVRHEQDLTMQLNSLVAILTNLFSEGPSEQGASHIYDLRRKVDQLREARDAVTNKIRSQFPEYSNLVHPMPTTIQAARSTLEPGESLISVHVEVDRSYIWAVPHKGKVFFRIIDVGKAELEKLVSSLRSSVEPDIKTLSDIPDYDVSIAYQLYDVILKPIDGAWKNAKNLLFVANGPLGQLPWSMLPTNPPKLSNDGDLLFAKYRGIDWLAKTHAVTVLPSVASLNALRGQKAVRKNHRPFVGFGDPYFSSAQALAAKKSQSVEIASTENTTRGMEINLRRTPQTRSVDNADIALLPRLPESGFEINSIAKILGADPLKDVFLGEKANERQVKGMDLTPYNVIAFATHGLIPGDLNGLMQPALAMSSPRLSGDKANDGLLTMGEIMGLKLNASWAVLSACNTAAADGKGAEAVSGLGRAFFYAGARALLVSNWPVHSAATTELTTELFRRQAASENLSRSEALRQTRVHLIDKAGFKDAQGRMVFSYAHPIFWAPFTLVGDGGHPFIGS
jgi:CHAT domain-containing protein/Tfp pilus assembly protein PilF